jgi:hypothetical protein
MFATIQGWPDARLPIDAVRDQVTRLGGEIVVVDGSDRPAPRIEQVGPDVEWLSRPGESVFQMRAEGYAVCQGDIIAVTEDHCAPAADWLDRIVEAHARHPEAIAVGGVVENGTTGHLIDWAAFIVTQGPFIGPIPNGPADRIAGAATISYKREILKRRPEHGALGAIELFDTAEMRRPGELLINDDSIRVRHYQSTGVGGTTAMQFHNGRAIAGFRRRNMTSGDWLRIVGYPLLPLYRTARTVRIGWGKRVPRSMVVATLPLMALLHYAQAAGEVLGYATGPGSSPRRLR